MKSAIQWFLNLALITMAWAAWATGTFYSNSPPAGILLLDSLGCVVEEPTNIPPADMAEVGGGDQGGAIVKEKLGA